MTWPRHGVSYESRDFRYFLFLSGVSALIFETLWFRKIGLVLGNSVWASSIVIAGFMAGLALGNTLILRYGQRLKPLFSSLLELTRETVDDFHWADALLNKRMIVTE